MPEGDRFESSLGAGWRGAFRLMTQEATAAEVSDKLIESLTKTLRREGGIPGLEAIIAVVERQHEFSPVEAYEALDRVVRDCGGHRHTVIAADTAKSSFVLSGLDAELTERGDLSRRVAVRACIALVDHYFFGRTRERLITAGRLRDHAEAHEWRNQTIEAVRPRLERIANRLLQSPDADGLRAPNRNAPRASTGDLLREQLGAGRPA